VHGSKSVEDDLNVFDGLEVIKKFTPHDFN
jgi:hypothetical protein